VLAWPKGKRLKTTASSKQQLFSRCRYNGRLVEAPEVEVEATLLLLQDLKLGRNRVLTLVLVAHAIKVELEEP